MTKIGSGDGGPPATAEAGGSRDTGEVDLQDDQLEEEVVKSNFSTLIWRVPRTRRPSAPWAHHRHPSNTLIGGLPLDAHDVTIGFGQWIFVGIPLAMVLVGPCAGCCSPRCSSSPR
ncbi:hypothetical protein QJS66_11580 [Kocuria rhizophila]|nr:hypothetical protein QJS66_11580 [Kocuria rhizophila]